MKTSFIEYKCDNDKCLTRCNIYRNIFVASGKCKACKYFINDNGESVHCIKSSKAYKYSITDKGVKTTFSFNPTISIDTIKESINFILIDVLQGIEDKYYKDSILSKITINDVIQQAERTFMLKATNKFEESNIIYKEEISIILNNLGLSNDKEL